MRSRINNRMDMTRFSILCMALLAMASCSKISEEPPATVDGRCRITVTCTPEPQTSLLTRGLTPEEESRIGDLNLYAVHTASGRVIHRYRSGGGSLAMSLTPGDYTFYAIANYGADLGDRDAASLPALSASFAEEPGAGPGLPMAVCRPVQVDGNMAFTLYLKRLVAKVSLTVGVALQLREELVVEDVQLRSAPAGCLFFADHRAGSSTFDYPCESVSGNLFRRDYYLPENMAGVNASILSEQEKNAAHAPAGASWLRIRARHEGRAVVYALYLGANNTTDFNVERNTVQYLNVTIVGSDPADLRVARFSLDVGAPASSYLPRARIELPFLFATDNQTDNRFTLSCALTQGRGRVLLDGREITATPVILPSGGCSRTLAFEPAAYGQQVALVLTVTDAGGGQVSRALSTYIAARGELSFSMPSLGSPRANNRTAFTFTVSEENYDEPFSLRLSTSTPSSIAVFRFRGRGLTPGEAASFEVEAGTHTVEIEAGNAVGEIDLTATVTDAWGRSRDVRQTARIAYDPLRIQPNLSLETAREAGPVGAYYVKNTVVFWVLAERPVPVDVTVSAQVFCVGRYTVDGRMQTVPVTVSATIPAGSASAYVRVPWPMDPVAYYDRNDLVALHGYEYERMYYDAGGCSPATDKGVSFYVVNESGSD